MISEKILLYGYHLPLADLITNQMMHTHSAIWILLPISAIVFTLVRPASSIWGIDAEEEQLDKEARRAVMANLGLEPPRGSSAYGSVDNYRNTFSDASQVIYVVTHFASLKTLLEFAKRPTLQLKVWKI